MLEAVAGCGARTKEDVFRYLHRCTIAAASARDMEVRGGRVATHPCASWLANQTVCMCVFACRPCSKQRRTRLPGWASQTARKVRMRLIHAATLAHFFSPALPASPAAAAAELAMIEYSKDAHQYQPTPLGRAVVASALPMEEALVIRVRGCGSTPAWHPQSTGTLLHLLVPPCANRRACPCLAQADMLRLSRRLSLLCDLQLCYLSVPPFHTQQMLPQHWKVLSKAVQEASQVRQQQRGAAAG